MNTINFDGLSLLTSEPAYVSDPVAQGEPWPELGTPGVDEELAYAVAHLRKAAPLANNHPTWLVGIDVRSATAELNSYSPRSAAAADEVVVDEATLAEHLNQAIQACDRYLGRYPLSVNITLVRNDLSACYYGLDA